MSYQTDTGRIQPQARELEEAILGALMLERKSLGEVLEILSPEDFYVDTHGVIYSAICRLHNERKPVDILTVTDFLRQSGNLETVGGPYFISQLTSKVASSSHVEYHAMVVKDKAIRRRAIAAANGISQSAYDDTEDIGDTLTKAGSEVDTLMDTLIGKSNGQEISKIIKDSSDSLYRRIELARKNIRSGVETGLADLNRLTNGWQPSELVIVAARPSMGKTALMLHFAKRAAMSGVPVAIFSLEMSGVSLIDRLILSECDVEPDRYKSGYLSNDEINKIEEAKGSLCSLPIYVDDNPCVSMGYIRNRSTLMHRKGQCGLIIVDYLQLGVEDEKERNREREVAKMSRMAKVTAKELSVPYILLSQLNRDCEKRPNKKPMLADLRESGAIEQDADVVAFIHRPGYYGLQVTNKDGEEEHNYGEFIIAKNRNGRTGLVKFRHNDSMTKFYDYDHLNSHALTAAF